MRKLTLQGFDRALLRPSKITYLYPDLFLVDLTSRGAMRRFFFRARFLQLVFFATCLFATCLFCNLIFKNLQKTRIEMNLDADDLYWLGADDGSPAVNKTLFDAGFYNVLLLDTHTFWTSEAVASNISMSQDPTAWTLEALLVQGFKMIEKSTICAVADGTGRAFVVCVYTRQVDGEIMRSFANQVFGGDGSILHRDVAGQSVVSRRGNKSQTGRMLMYGTHTLYGVNASKLGLPSHWQPAVYMPCATGIQPRTYDKLGRFATHMSRLENTITPAIGEKRRLQIDELDPTRRHRMSTDCDGLSLSITSGYAIGPHDDSGIINEAILFLNRDGPMPPNHAWLFVAAGVIFKLPNTKGEATHISVAADVYHGTLPSSSSVHLKHGNVASALVTRKDLARAFSKQVARGEETPLPFTASYLYGV